ncbi:hypothetical protein ASD12_25835 [Mesorhizobium sp. Root102]|nr:hypothetical protein ASD12_25835 [Mesorhizobium sp. Root102]
MVNLCSQSTIAVQTGRKNDDIKIRCKVLESEIFPDRDVSRETNVFTFEQPIKLGRDGLCPLMVGGDSITKKAVWHR